ncbi:MAG: hypothetical protein JO335_03800 [Sphingomonas sp.]|nr:hypothetical protein [Sphingomonas sp.]
MSEAAARSNFELKRFHYHVGRLFKAGLLKVDSVRTRAGRAIKLYRTVAPAFYVPSEALPKPSTDEIAKELRELLQADEAQASAGILVSLGANMEPKVEFISAEGHKRNGFELWRILRLKRIDYERLRSELDAVLSRYQDCSDKEGNVYLMHAGGALRERYEGVVDNA